MIGGAMCRTYRMRAMGCLRKAAGAERARDPDTARAWRGEAVTMLRLAAIWADGH